MGRYGYLYVMLVGEERFGATHAWQRDRSVLGVKSEADDLHAALGSSGRLISASKLISHATESPLDTTLWKVASAD
jgi:hypothetical protein